MHTQTKTKPEEDPDSSRPLKSKSVIAENIKTFGLIALIIGKTKGGLIALLKVKGVITFITMMIDIVAYWWTGRLGLPGAIGFVGLIFIHEMGHVLALRYYGVPATAPLFIPFVGAVVGMKAMPKNAFEEAMIAIAGPVVGSLGALACLPVYLATGSKLWLWLFATGVLINLFNLIPVSPLDGGRVIGAVWRGFWAFGIAILFGLAIAQKNMALIIIGIVCLLEITTSLPLQKRAAIWTWGVTSVLLIVISVAWQSLLGLLPIAISLFVWYCSAGPLDRASSRNDEIAEYTNLPIKLRLAVGAAYLSLTAALGFAMWWLNTLHAFTAVPR